MNLYPEDKHYEKSLKEKLGSLETEYVNAMLEKKKPAILKAIFQEIKELRCKLETEPDNHTKTIFFGRQ